tara:strand:- start:4389 stop:4610 length:222 start_codon:yes stop_codon:yes gene_type:complete
MNDSDDKVLAMTNLLDSLKYTSYPVPLVYKLLNALDKYGIPYLLDELPEGKGYTFYSQKLDDYIVDIIKKNKK